PLADARFPADEYEGRPPSRAGRQIPQNAVDQAAPPYERRAVASGDALHARRRIFAAGRGRQRPGRRVGALVSIGGRPGRKTGSRDAKRLTKSAVAASGSTPNSRGSNCERS